MLLELQINYTLMMPNSVSAGLGFLCWWSQ